MRIVLRLVLILGTPGLAWATPPHTGFSIWATKAGMATDFAAVPTGDRVVLTSTLLDHQPGEGLVEVWPSTQLPTFTGMLAPLNDGALDSLADGGSIPRDVVIERVEAVWYNSSGAVQKRMSEYLLYGAVDGVFELLTQDAAEERWNARGNVIGESFYNGVHPSLREHHLALRVDSLQGEPERVAPASDEPVPNVAPSLDADNDTTFDTGVNP